MFRSNAYEGKDIAISFCRQILFALEGDCPDIILLENAFKGKDNISMFFRRSFLRAGAQRGFLFSLQDTEGCS